MSIEPTVERYGGGDRTGLGEYIQTFTSLFGTGKKPKVTLSRFSGRVLRGVDNDDFDTLTDNPRRRVVFLLDEIALGDLVGLDGLEILKHIGYPAGFIRNLLASGTRFKLVLLPQATLKLATWDNLLDVVQRAYPAWCEKIEAARPILKCCGYDEAVSAGGAVTEVRAFLQNKINVNRLFAGDGYTRIEGAATKKVYAEYVTVNRRLADFGTYALVNFPVGG